MVFTLALTFTIPFQDATMKRARLLLPRGMQRQSAKLHGSRTRRPDTRSSAGGSDLVVDR
jgi:hypothetical protein